MNVLCIIQARTISKRFPDKVLMKIQGKSIIKHIVDFLKFSKLTNKIIVATTILQSDNKIEKLAKKINVECFRGSSKDVLERYYECAKFYKGDLIVRLTADDPLVDPILVDEVIKTCFETNCDYASNMIERTFPYGYSSGEGLTFSILEKLHKTEKNPISREHVTHDIVQHPDKYNVRKIKAEKGLVRPHWRLTVDYPEDIELMNDIFSKLYKPNSYIKYRDLVNLLDRNQELLKINQKYC